MIEENKELSKNPSDSNKTDFTGIKRAEKNISPMRRDVVMYPQKKYIQGVPGKSDNIKRLHNGVGQQVRKSSGGSRYGLKSRKRVIPSITHLRDDAVDNIKPRKSTKDFVKVIPIGGVEEIGRNMIAVEYGDDIIVMDAGLEFPTSAHPGVDYLIPNVSYLKKYKDLIRGIVISHGHLDHVGALPYVIEDMGNPPIYTTEFTAAFIRKKHSEFKHLPTPNIILVKKGNRLPIGKEGMFFRFFGVEHAIPDSIGTILETKFGDIVYPGDFKIARDRDNNPIEIEEYEEMGKKGVLLLILESTNIEQHGFSKTDEEVATGLEAVYREAKGRIITATFSSQIERVVSIVKISEDLGRKVAIAGISLKTNIEIAQEYNIFTPKKDTIIDIKDIDKYPAERIMIICTGAQGEENAALVRITNKKDRDVKIQKGDTIVLSSSIVPGNERPVQALKDNIARQGGKVIHYKMAVVHASGHAYRGETEILHKLVKPKFFIPVHGFYYNLIRHKELAMDIGMPEENISVPFNNGVIIRVNDKEIIQDKDSIPANFITVDGLGVGDVKDVVLRDRNVLSQDGIFVVFAVVDGMTGQVKTSPDIISRGFVYLREAQEMLHEVRGIIRKTIEANTKIHPIDIQFVTEEVRESVGKFLFQHTKRRPMVLPVIVRV
ncbi:MAG: ribonuclease J [Patescibacteria group bacterium]